MKVTASTLTDAFDACDADGACRWAEENKPQRNANPSGFAGPGINFLQSADAAHAHHCDWARS
jgi:hypothetical protein